jgi:hypothetical protein
VLASVPVAAKPQNESTATAESVRGVALETEGKYSVELFKEGGEGADQEEIIDRHNNLTVPEPSIAVGCPNIRAGWSCCATERAFWRGAIGRRRCPKASGKRLLDLVVQSWPWACALRRDRMPFLRSK